MIRTCLWILAALAVSGSNVLAAEDGGTRSIFAYGAGNRGLAMGGAFGSIADDASAPLWNPAGLGLVPRLQLQATRTSLYGLDMTEEFVGFALPSWRLGTVAMTFRHFGVGGIEGRDDRNVSTGEFSNSETQITLSYGRRLAEAWSLGGTLKLQSQSLAEESAAGVGLDVGLLSHPALALGSDQDWAERFAMGITVRNLVEPSLTLDQDEVSDAISTRLSASYRIPFGHGGRHLLTAFDIDKTRGMDPDVYAGLEFQLHSLLVLRTGFNQGSLTAGTGIQWRNLSVDYAFEDNELGSLHRFGLSVGLGATVEEKRLSALRAEEEALSSRLDEAFAQAQERRSRELMEQARSEIGSGRYDEGLELLSVVSVLSPEMEGLGELEVRSLNLKAGASEDSQNYAEAILIYGQALAVDPANRKAGEGVERCRLESSRRARRSEEIQNRFTEGLDAFAGGDLLLAKARFEAILQVQPDVEASEMLERTQRAMERRVGDLLDQAEILLQAGILDDSRAMLDEASRLAPGSSRVRNAKASLDRARAAARRTPLVAEDTGGSPAAGKSGSARELTAEQQQEMEQFYKNGLAAIDNGNTADAIRYLEYVHSVDPGYLEVREYLKREYLLKGMEAYSGGKLGIATEVWGKALLLDPEDEKTQAYLAKARQQLSRIQEISGTTSQ